MAEWALIVIVVLIQETFTDPSATVPTLDV